MKSLILAEKPSVARDIAEALNIKQKKNGYIENEKYIVTWALGHLVTNATPEQYDGNVLSGYDSNDNDHFPWRLGFVFEGNTLHASRFFARKIFRSVIKWFL